MRKTIGLLAATGLLVAVAFAQSQRASKTQDEQTLRKIESQTAQIEQANDVSKMGALADDWVLLGRKILSKSEFQQNVKTNSANGPSPYTVEKKNMRVDLFGDTAVVTYIKEYRQTADTTQFFGEDDTDVFTRSSDGWRLRLTKVVPPRPLQRQTDAPSQFSIGYRQFCVAEAAHQVVVDQAGGLHQGVANRRAHKAESALL